MVRSFAAIAGIWIAVGTAQAASFIAKLDKHESAFGEPLILRLQNSDSRSSIEALDLTPLRQDFEVFASAHTRSSASRGGRTRVTDSMDVTLYPLRVGQLAIPTLTLGAHKTKPLEVSVVPDQGLSVRAYFTPNELYERQQCLLVVEIRDQGQYQWSPPANLVIPGIQLRALKERQRDEATATGTIVVQQFRWAALPLKADRYAVKLPMLDGYKLGTHVRLPLDPMGLQAKALPAYLPVSVPIGKPVALLDPVPSTATLDRPLTWGMRLTVDGLTPDGVRQLLRLPEGRHGDWFFYRAELSLEENDDTGARSVRLDIPVKPLRAGEGSLPEFTLPYFDTHLQRIESIFIPATRVHIIDPLWQKVRIGGIVTIVLAVLSFAAWRIGHLWRQYQARQRALMRIRRAVDLAELVCAVRKFASPPEPQTLDQWMRRYGTSPALRQLATQLRGAHYGRSHEDNLEKLKQRCLTELSCLKPLTKGNAPGK